MATRQPNHQSLLKTEKLRKIKKADQTFTSLLPHSSRPPPHSQSPDLTYPSLLFTRSQAPPSSPPPPAVTLSPPSSASPNVSNPSLLRPLPPLPPLSVPAPSLLPQTEFQRFFIRLTFLSLSSHFPLTFLSLTLPPSNSINPTTLQPYNPTTQP